jgi:hypothetical protein
MAAYLIVDVDDLLQRFTSKGISLDLQELAVGLRGGAALAAGLFSADSLKAVAVANWSAHGNTGTNFQRIFRSAGYDVFDMPRRETLADALIVHYFSFDPEPVDELILATTNPDLVPLVRRVKTTRNARIRIWGADNILAGTELANQVIFQPLESLPGIQTKNVAVYIDFENIAISLNEQGFVVNLDHLIDRFVMQAKAHGQVVKMAAYAPWGQRGSLPPLVDNTGREIADDAPSRLMLANIDPVFNLPGKNSADMRIARDVITDGSQKNAADVFIMASGDRDFNQVLNSLPANNKTVIVWGVRGSTSRQLENNPGITVEYIEDFTNLQTHQSLSVAAVTDGVGARQCRQRAVVEHVRHQAHVLDDGEAAAFGHRHAGRFQAAVLQGVQAEVGQVGDRLARGEDTEHAAHASHDGIAGWPAKDQASVAAASGAVRRLRRRCG